VKIVIEIRKGLVEVVEQSPGVSLVVRDFDLEGCDEPGPVVTVYKEKEVTRFVEVDTVL
jgi:hypothetical protein